MTDRPIFVISGELISSKNSRKSIPMKSRSTGKVKWVPMKSDVAKNDEKRLLSLFLRNTGSATRGAEKLPPQASLCA